MIERETLLIGGEWVPAGDGSTFDDFNPSTGEVCCQVADAGPEETRRAVDAAATAFAGWRQTTPFERSGLLTKAADVLESRAPEWASRIVPETGSVFGKAMYEVGYAASILRAAAAQCHQAVGEMLPSKTPGRTNIVERVPAGVVATISPWNFPLLLSMRGVALPVALGNTVVLKPSEHSPISGGTILGKVFVEAGLPPGVLNVLTCSRKNAQVVGDTLLEHPAVTRLSFTGSTRVGKALGAKAIQNLVRPVLELGGKDPIIVLDGADVEQAVKAAVFSCFFHQGQICMSTERFIVERGVVEEFTSKLVARAKALNVGNASAKTSHLGPIIHRGQLQEIEAQVAEAVAEGAQVLCGGTASGLFYPPTVLSGVKPSMRIARDETFGPVAPIIEVRDSGHAVEVANDSDYGLSAGIFAASEQQALEVASKLESGMVHIGDGSVYDEPHCPFGGTKASGLGRHGGQQGAYEFTETRWMGLQRTTRNYPI